MTETLFGDVSDRRQWEWDREIEVLLDFIESKGLDAEMVQFASKVADGEEREGVKPGTALHSALLELQRDGYVHTTAGGRFAPRGTKPGKRLYSLKTIDRLKEIVQLDYTGYCTYGRIT